MSSQKIAQEFAELYSDMDHYSSYNTGKNNYLAQEEKIRSHKSMQQDKHFLDETNNWKHLHEKKSVQKQKKEAAHRWREESSK